MRRRRSVILCCIGFAILAAVPRARTAPWFEGGPVPDLHQAAAQEQAPA